MGLFKQETAYERRRRELNEESERVRKSLQSLMKTVKRDATNPAAASLPNYNDGDYSTQNDSGVLVDAPADDCVVDVGQSDGNLFSDPETRSSKKSGDQLPPYGTARLRHYQNRQKENLPNYLATGSFGKRGPVTREKKIQRNKAVFMAILAVIAVFSLLSWLR